MNGIVMYKGKYGAKAQYASWIAGDFIIRMRKCCINCEPESFG